MMFCSYCGKQIPEDSLFCRYCGKKIDPDSPAASTSLTPASTSSPSQPQDAAHSPSQPSPKIVASDIDVTAPTSTAQSTRDKSTPKQTSSSSTKSRWDLSPTSSSNTPPHRPASRTKAQVDTGTKNTPSKTPFAYSAAPRSTATVTEERSATPLIIFGSLAAVAIVAIILFFMRPGDPPDPPPPPPVPTNTAASGGDSNPTPIDTSTPTPQSDSPSNDLVGIWTKTGGPQECCILGNIYVGQTIEFSDTRVSYRSETFPYIWQDATHIEVDYVTPRRYDVIVSGDTLQISETGGGSPYSFHRGPPIYTPTPTPTDTPVVDSSSLYTLSGDGSAVSSVAFSPDGQILAAGYKSDQRSGGMIKLWQVSDRSLLQTLKDGETQSVTSVAFSPDGQFLAAGADYPPRVQIWQVSSGTLLRNQEGRGISSDVVTSVAFSPDGQILAYASPGENVQLRRVSDGSQVRAPENKSDPQSDIVAFSPDGRILALPGTTVPITNSEPWEKVDLWQLSDPTPNYPEGYWSILRSVYDATAKDVDIIESIAFSPDGQILATSDWRVYYPQASSSLQYETTVKLWQVSDGSPLRTLGKQSESFRSVAFSPDGKVLASGSDDALVRLWQVSDGTLLQTLGGHTKGVTSVAFSPDGQTLATGSFDGTVRIWKVK